MQCPQCNSMNIVRDPPNRISAIPSYHCGKCQARLRGPRTFFIYLSVLLIGLAFAGGMIAVVIGSRADRRHIGIWQWVHAGEFAIIELIVAGYAVVHLSRPAARHGEDDRKGRG